MMFRALSNVGTAQLFGRCGAATGLVQTGASNHNALPRVVSPVPGKFIDKLLVPGRLYAIVMFDHFMQSAAG
jgi:hypothetical protein